MRLRTLVVALVLLPWSGCASSPPTFVKADVSNMITPHRGQHIATITYEQVIAKLAGLLEPGVGTGRRSSVGVAGIVTHEIRFTRADGKTDVVSIYNGGIAWSEGRGDWLLGESAREEFARIIASSASPN